MTRSLLVGSLLAVVAVAAACGESAEQKQAEANAKAAQDVAKGAEAVAQGAQATAKTAEQGMQQMMQGLQQMAQGAQGGQPVKIVDYEELKALLPEFSGWERSGVKGKQATMGISISTAEAHYAKGDANIKLEITDTSLSQALIAPFMMFGANYSERSDDGYKKGINLAGYPGFESWEKANKNGEVHLLVGNRFIVNAEGNGLDSTDPARNLVQAVNLSKLAGMK